MSHFISLDLAEKQYRYLKKFHFPFGVDLQIRRAALSVCLNLAEGNAKSGLKDRRRFFNIAYASQKEVQMILKLEDKKEAFELADKLAAHLHNLQRNAPT